MNQPKATRRRGAWLGVIGVAGLLMAAGCRQTVGEVPVPVDEQPNKIEDISQDLRNVASGQADARRDLADDLNALDSNPRPLGYVTRLADSLGAALDGKPLPEEQAQGLAQLLFVTTTALQLNEGQRRQLAADLRASVQRAGADIDAADRVADAAIELQEALTLNRKRWYHLF